MLLFSNSSRCGGKTLGPVVQGSDCSYLVSYGVVRLKIEVPIGVGRLPMHIGGEGLVGVAGDEYI